MRYPRSSPAAWGWRPCRACRPRRSSHRHRWPMCSPCRRRRCRTCRTGCARPAPIAAGSTASGAPTARRRWSASSRPTSCRSPGSSTRRRRRRWASIRTRCCRPRSPQPAAPTAAGRPPAAGLGARGAGAVARAGLLWRCGGWRVGRGHRGRDRELPAGARTAAGRPAWSGDGHRDGPGAGRAGVSVGRLRSRCAQPELSVQPENVRIAQSINTWSFGWDTRTSKGRPRAWSRKRANKGRSCRRRSTPVSRPPSRRWRPNGVFRLPSSRG